MELRKMGNLKGIRFRVQRETGAAEELEYCVR